MLRLALFFFFSSSPAFADTPLWRALLHFEGRSSAVPAGSVFFLSPRGHEDAAAERAATEAYFRETPDGRCRFPARALALGLAPEGQGPYCDQWQTWRKALGAKGAELVFASAYLNSPSSMYGHTLLKFPRGGAELLDYTLNYGADTGQAAGAVYVWRGLTGGFSGYFATAPFYLKVREYLHVENRDFWVYPILLNPAELERLVAHAWELKDIQFPYYFLRKNCAYYLLQFLEVARPGQGLTDSFPLWAVPMDTIRRLQAKGWLGEPRLRPSRAKILAKRRGQLTLPERQEAERFAEGGLAAAAPSRAVAAAAYDLWRFRHESRALSAQEKATEAALLGMQASATGPAPEIATNETPPDFGHRSARLQLAYGRSVAGGYGELAYRGTLHDLLADPTGYDPHSELSMGDVRLRWLGQRLSLERFDLLRIRALSPWETWMPRMAWSFRAGAISNRELECSAWRCLAASLNGGVGLAGQWGFLHAFALWEIDTELGVAFARKHRVATGPVAGLHFPLWPGARALLEGEYRLRLSGERRQKREARVGLGQSLGGWEVRVTGAARRQWREAQVGVARYF